MATPPKPSNATIAQPPSAIARDAQLKDERASNSALNCCNEWPKRPAKSLVALSRQIRNDGIAAFNLHAVAGGKPGKASDQQRPEIRRGEARAIEMQCVEARQKRKRNRLKCSTVCDANGTGNSGASGRNDVEARWIAAQIAQ